MKFVLEQIEKLKTYIPQDKEEFKVELLDIKERFAQEGKNTKKMWDIYNRFLSGMSTQQEITWANEQAIDVLRSVGLAGLIILPGTVFILPVIIALGNLVGINILPSSFREKENGNKTIRKD